MRKPPFLSYVFKHQGKLVNIYRTTTTAAKDSFGRSVAPEPELVGTTTVVLDQTSNLPDLTQTADRATTVFKGKYYVRLSDTPTVINGDRFTANSINWLVIKTVTVAALDLKELYCEAV